MTVTDDGYLLLAPDPLTYTDGIATQDQVAGEHERRMLAVHGYRSLEPSYVCPRWVVGKRHLRARWDDDSRCVCPYSGFEVPGIGLWDHPHAWLTRDGSKVITLEPYSVTEVEFAAYRLLLASLGLAVRVGQSSQWNRRSTHLLIIKAGS